MKNTDNYSVLYKIKLSLIIDKNDIINISSSDIVSLAIINNYDTMTYPIIRVRLYSDINTIQKITECPDDVYMRGNLDGGIYRMNDEEKSPVIVSTTKGITLQTKVYIENKNIASSSMDQYINGVKKDSNLNENVKVPIELYCYNETLIHRMKQKVQSIYKNMSIASIIEDVFRRGNINDYVIDPLNNQGRFEQILIPNMNIIQTLSFFDTNYGLYKKGSQLYGDIDKLYLCDTNVNNGLKPIPIYVESAKNNTDMSGMKKTNNGFYMTTMAGNVSIRSETDIERVINSQNIVAINVNDLNVETNELKKLYDISMTDNVTEKISTPDTLHKTLNKYLTDTRIARINENMTKVDVSGSGFDIERFKVNTRFNLIFSSPIRGMNMNDYYRATYVCHVLSNLDSDLFVAQTTMNLCNN